MTTFGELVDQTWSLLHSYTGIHEQATWLSEACTDISLTMTVNNIEMISLGVCEVGEELVFVSAVDDAGVVTLAPYGRGYMGTTAVAHSANDKVLYDPAFPRVEIQRAINQTLAGIYPKLFQVKETTFPFTGMVSTYEMPADAESVLRVRYEATGPSNAWPAVTGWFFDPTSEEATGKAITLLDPPMSGRTVKVVYTAPLGTFAAPSDTLADVGFPESAIDVLLYGAASRLVRFLGPARIELGAVENVSRAQIIQSGDPATMANQFYAMYIQRLEEERKKLLELNPADPHFTG